MEEVGLAWLDYNAQIENLRTSLIQYPLNGRLPKLVEGAMRVPGAAEFLALLNEANGPVPPLSPELLAGFGAGRKDGAEDLPLSERCLPGAYVPIVPGFDNNYLQILQGKDHVVLLAESRDPRIVPLDSRAHASEKLRRWAGDSRGHWDGDTLVVETTNFNGRTRSFVGAGTSFDKVVTERFTRTSRDALEYEATVVDPKTFADKIVLSFPMGRVESRFTRTRATRATIAWRSRWLALAGRSATRRSDPPMAVSPQPSSA